MKILGVNLGPNGLISNHSGVNGPLALPDMGIFAMMSTIGPLPTTTDPQHVNSELKK